MERTDISIIIPIHEIDEKTKPLLGNAIKSIYDQLVKPDEIIFVIPKNSTGIELAINECVNDSIKFNIVKNDGETDFCSQMNFGVNNVKTKYFSWIEIDDEFSKIWIKNAVEYITAYPEVGVFLPLIVDVTETGAFISFTNEAVWANEFSEELGVLDMNALLTYQNFNIDGMVMDVETYKEFGGLKSKMVLTFIYEFLLRLVHNDVKIMSLPRFGYKHVNQRTGGLFNTYKNTLTPDETKWWLAQAKKEYYFNHDRVITYNK